MGNVNLFDTHNRICFPTDVEVELRCHRPRKSGLSRFEKQG